MSNSGLSRTTLTGASSFTGFKNKINDVLQGKCYIYIARGEFWNNDIPSSKNQLGNLISATNCPFLPLGDMDAGGSNITWTEKTIDTDFSVLGAGYEVSGTFVSITVNKRMFQFISELGYSKYSFLFMPEGINNIFFAISGVNVTTEGNLGVVEDGLSKITFKVSRKANKITDVIKFAVFSSGTTNPEYPNNTENNTNSTGDGEEDDDLL
jgi:hypothetical protein